MNQHQRKFLLETIEKQYKAERDELNSRKPDEPSLNNYLIAAVLDGSFAMKSADEVRAAFANRVRNLGKNEALVESGSRYDTEASGTIRIPALTLFEMPAGYQKAKEEYDAALAKWREEVAALEASINAMRLRVQIGSDKALMALVDQADKLCSMSLTASNKLLLTGS